MGNTIAAQVAKEIASSSAEVEEKVVKAIAKLELDRRADSVVQAYQGLKKLERNFKKLGPDVETFDEKGERTSQTYSKARTEERKKATDRINKWTNAINKALDKKEFDDVYNLGSVEDKE